MKSPFPGMDPYLELWWRDVHHRLCTYACDALQSQLGRALRARIDERLVVEADESGHSIYPDLRIIESDRPRQTRVQPADGVAVAEPYIVHIEIEPARQAFINIIDVRSGNRLITSIEILSPSNKLSGDGRDQYVRKQRETREAGASLVEIDLVRTGKRPTLAQLRVSAHRDTTYQVCIFRAWRRDVCEVVPIPLTAKLPTVPIPLRQDDPEVSLDVQSLMDQVYRNGAYAVEIDYAKPCHPPLTTDEMNLAAPFLRDATRPE